MSNRVQRNTIGPILLKMLQDKPHRTVHVDDIQEAYRVKYGKVPPRNTVQQVAARLAETTPGVITITRGNAWKYDPYGKQLEGEPAKPKPEAPATPELEGTFALVGWDSNQAPILKGPDGHVYRAVKL